MIIGIVRTENTLAFMKSSPYRYLIKPFYQEELIILVERAMALSRLNEI